MNKINRSPTYLSSMATPCSSLKGRSSLLSAGRYVAPGTHLVFSQRSVTVTGPPSEISYFLMSAIPTPRLSFALNSKLTFSVLPMDQNDYTAQYALLNIILVRGVLSNDSCRLLYCIVFDIPAST